MFEGISSDTITIMASAASGIGGAILAKLPDLYNSYLGGKKVTIDHEEKEVLRVDQGYTNLIGYFKTEMTELKKDLSDAKISYTASLERLDAKHTECEQKHLKCVEDNAALRGQLDLLKTRVTVIENTK